MHASLNTSMIRDDIPFVASSSVSQQIRVLIISLFILTLRLVDTV